MKQELVIIFLVLGVAGGPVRADSNPPPFADFTFRRVKAPDANRKKLIDVQVEPADPAALAALQIAQPQVPVSVPGAYDWFWDRVSPSMAEAGAGRLEGAVNHILDVGAANGIVAPRRQLMQSLIERFGRDILIATAGTRVSPALVLAVIGVESGGRVDAVSSAGAEGLMQLIPATSKRFNVADPKNAADNIRGGVAFLDLLMEQFNGDPILVLAGYNAGENAVKNFGGVPEFAETRAYVPKVLSAWSVASELCLTPPQFASDGCVFAVQEVKAENE